MSVFPQDEEQERKDAYQRKYDEWYKKNWVMHARIYPHALMHLHTKARARARTHSRVWRRLCGKTSFTVPSRTTMVARVASLTPTPQLHC